MTFSKILISVLFFLNTFNACPQVNHKNTSNANLIEMQDEILLRPVKTLIEAMEAEDAELIGAQFSKTATQAYGADGTMKTPEETVRWLKSDIIDRQGKVTNPHYTVISENEVVVKGQYSSHGYSNKADFLFTVEKGFITGWRMRY